MKKQTIARSAKKKHKEKENVNTNAILVRLEEFLRTKGDTLPVLTAAISVSRTYFTVARFRGAELGSDKICRILQLYPDLSADWLLTGYGMMYKGTTSLKEQKKIINQETILKTAREKLGILQQNLHELQKQFEQANQVKKNRKKL